jgi:hypothetical protein
MTTRELNQWPAQAPPADFADRAVAAMLKAERRSPARRVDRRWVAGLALAAVLAAAGAWGMVEIRKARAPQTPAVVPTPAATSVEPAAPKRTSVQTAVAAPSASQPTPAVTVTPSAPVRPKPSASAPVAVPSASVVVPDKKIVAPRCECPPAEGFCTCIE